MWIRTSTEYQVYNLRGCPNKKEESNIFIAMLANKKVFCVLMITHVLITSANQIGVNLSAATERTLPCDDVVVTLEKWECDFQNKLVIVEPIFKHDVVFRKFGVADSFKKKSDSAFVGYPCAKSRQNIFTVAKVTLQYQIPLFIWTRCNCFRHFPLFS